MTRDETEVRETRPRGGVMYVARSRGMLSGLLLVLLGIWGALIPFVGPYFNYAYTPDRAWAWTMGRLWLEILPGAAAVLGGLMLMGTAHRAVGVFAGWLASVAGAWFVVGPILSRLWDPPAGSAGTPVGGPIRQVFEEIGFFYGLGAAILFLAAQALGRFTVRSVRDVRAAETVRRTSVTEPTGTRPVAAQPVTPVAETRGERAADFEDNRVAAAPAETVEAPVAGDGATRVESRHTT